MATACRVEAAVAGRRRAGTAEHTLDLDLPVDEPVPLRAVVDAWSGPRSGPSASGPRSSASSGS